MNFEHSFAAAHQDRVALAKQLRNERSLTSHLINALIEVTQVFPDGTEREVAGEERDYLLESYDRFCGCD